MIAVPFLNDPTLVCVLFISRKGHAIEEIPQPACFLESAKEANTMSAGTVIADCH